jgi:hypothetical protein
MALLCPCFSGILSEFFRKTGRLCRNFSFKRKALAATRIHYFKPRSTLFKMKNFQLKSAFSAFLLLFAFAFTACDKDDDDTKVEPQPVVPTITITSPAAGQEVKANQTLNITGSIVAPNTLHGYTIIIRKKADSTEVFNKEIHEHKPEIAINQPWTVDNYAAHVDLELEIIGVLDHDGNTITKKVSFHAMP